MPMVPMPGGGDDADSSGGFSIHSLSKMANIQKASRVVVAAAIISNQMATLEELSKAWNQGLEFMFFNRKFDMFRYKMIKKQFLLKNLTSLFL